VERRRWVLRSMFRGNYREGLAGKRSLHWLLNVAFYCLISHRMASHFWRLVKIGSGYE
jgi:hypothetical protein